MESNSSSVIYLFLSSTSASHRILWATSGVMGPKYDEGVAIPRDGVDIAPGVDDARLPVGPATGVSSQRDRFFVAPGVGVAPGKPDGVAAPTLPLVLLVGVSSHLLFVLTVLLDKFGVTSHREGT